MTDREKMIDLIINAKKSDPETGSFTEYLADFLLGYGIKLPDPTPQPGNPLTLEQLREMDEQPVWIVEYPDWGHWELSEDANDYIVDRNLNFYGMKHDDPDGRYGLHKLGWLAYSCPPAHIDRGEWTAEWIYPENEWNLPRCSKCGCNSKDATYGHKDRFCPKCGRAMTEEAWAELEQRLQRAPLPKPPEEG